MSSLAVFLSLALGAFAIPHTSHSLAKRSAQTSAPSGCVTVRGSGTKSGEYATVSSALAGSGYTLDTSSYADNTVTITHRLDAVDTGSDEKSSTGDFRSDNIAVYNINFVNSYGKGSQAVAVTAIGNQQAFYRCGFYGYQDTLYAKTGDQYYAKCYIEGAADYIFGDASAWFSRCTLASIGGGSITAQNRASTSETTSYVIDHSTVCRFSQLQGISRTFLSGIWQITAASGYDLTGDHCNLTDIVNSKGWTTMAAGAVPTYEEFNNTGAGSDTSKREYETNAASAVTMSQLWVTSGRGWIDSLY
ncbi:carbohydrate esterase family 8 protein [Cadophora sp. DSE1049]|nr:carbohydrate esterase family 8 protein [Cadophora sp. DSE1049]